MTRLSFVAVALAVALSAPAMAGVKYNKNGPNVLVPITDNTAQPIAPWVQGDPELAGNVTVDDVHDYAVTSPPIGNGRLQLRAVRSAKSGKIALYLGIKPSATSPSVPTSVALFGLKALDYEIGRLYGGEKVAPVSHVHSEQNPATKLYHLVFTLETPLPKGKMTWFVIKTLATKTEPGTIVTFADNETPNSPWPKYTFVRGASTATP